MTKSGMSKQPTAQRNGLLAHFSLYLRTQREFDRVFRKGIKQHGRFTTVLFLPEHKTRFGIVIGLKVSKKAVVRNRKKRQVRAILAALKPRLTKTGWCMIVMKPGSEASSFHELEQEIALLLTKLHVLSSSKES